MIVMDFQAVFCAAYGAGAGFTVQKADFTDMIAAALNFNADNLTVCQLVDAVVLGLCQVRHSPAKILNCYNRKIEINS